MLACPLCAGSETSPYHSDRAREYFHCSVCALVFAHPDSHLTREEEYQRYEQHENDLEDRGYRTFLQKMSEPMLQRIPPGSHGLDFGSGPGPLLKRIFEEQGHRISIYDPFFAQDESVLNTKYDFITATEVAEHLHHPLRELDRLWSILKPQGLLGLMTSMRVPGLDFKRWHYHRDPTHVVFFAPETMIWLAEHWRAHVDIMNDSVVVFQKN